MTAADAYPKTVVLTDGTHVVLRLATAAETAGGPADLVVVAVDGEHVAGELRLRRGTDGSARVAVTLRPAWRGRRLGTWLLLDAVHAAERLGVARLGADVPDGEPELAAALVRLDFFDEGSAGGAAPPGVRRMAKRLHRAWTDF